MDINTRENHQKSEKKRGRRNQIIISGMFILLIVLILVSFTLGRYNVEIKDLFFYMGKNMGMNLEIDQINEHIIASVRFPRIIAAVLTGLALSISGASYQGIFKNPMVSPDILGASAGAGFGASLGIIMSLPTILIQLMAFGFGIISVALSCLIAGIVGRRENVTLILVLAGMVVSSLFSAFISIIKYMADPYGKLPEITFWLMGSISDVKNSDLIFMIVPVVICLTIIFLVRWKINVLSFGDEEASALGVNAGRLRLVIIICATMMTATVVSVAGQIGWIGLVIPHLARMIVGPDYRYLIPATAILGGIFLLLVDNIARTVLQVEIPLGILTSIIGAPFFVYLILRGKKGWI
nr:iron ABC transporter permease [uncultured Acetobacterium sp.]